MDFRFSWFDSYDLGLGLWTGTLTRACQLKTYSYAGCFYFKILTIITEPEWRNEENIYLTSNIPKNILLHKWIQFQLNPLLSLRLRQLVRSRSLFFILTRARDTGQGSGSDRDCYYISQFSSCNTCILKNCWSLPIFLEILDLFAFFSLFMWYLDERNNIWTLQSVVMYSPTISIRITDADTRGSGAREQRGDQNPEHAPWKIETRGTTLSANCVLIDKPESKVRVPKKSQDVGCL